MSKRPSTSENHDKAPICAAFVKAMREEFGEDQVQVIWVSEGQVVLGQES